MPGVTRSNLIARRDIVRVLERWQRGEMTAVQVQAFAEQHYCVEGVEHDDWEGDGEERVSVASSVLGVLENLAIDLVTADDVPALLDFLDTRRGFYHPRERLLRRLLAEADFEHRRRALRDTPPYARWIARLEGRD